MGLSEQYAGSLDTIAGHAEQVCSVVEGTRPPPGIEAVSSSWQRSVKIVSLLFIPNRGRTPDDNLSEIAIVRGGLIPGHRLATRNYWVAFPLW
jgi:hypothetical protein